MIDDNTKIKVLINQVFADNYEESISTILKLWMNQVKINKRNKLYRKAYSIVYFLKNEGKSKYKVVTDNEGFNYLITTPDFNEALEKFIEKEEKFYQKLAACNTLEELSDLYEI
jgi:hypothetical protein